MIRISSLLLLAAATSPVVAQPIALTHVRIIDGTGKAPIEDGTVLINQGRIVAAGRQISTRGARILDRSGDTVLPGLISDHSHVGQIRGTTAGAANYTRDTILRELSQYRRYGVTTIVALGNNGPLFDPLRKEAHQGKLPADLFGVDQGIGVANGAPPQTMVKVGPDQLYRPATLDEARADVRKMAAAGTDLVKIWVDDFGGSVPVKMSPDIYRTVIDESHKLGLRVAAHIHDLSDAEGVVAAGADIIAHGVRDTPVPPEFVATLKQKGVWYIATLALDDATVAWAEQLPWTKTPFTRAALSPELAAQIDDPAWREKTLATPQMAPARASLTMNEANLKTLVEAGVKVGFGTDSGATPVRVAGLAEHRELMLSVQAGLSPMRAITMATRDAAALMNLSDRGTIAPGKRADLLIVQGDPSRDIGAMDRIVETWANGSAVPGPLPLAPAR